MKVGFKVPAAILESPGQGPNMSLFPRQEYRIKDSVHLRLNNNIEKGVKILGYTLGRVGKKGI